MNFSFVEDQSSANAMRKRISTASRKLKYAKWIGYFAIIDLLFLPYFQLIVLPYSLPVLVLTMAWLKVPVRNDWYKKSFLIISLCVSLSFLISLTLRGSQPFIIENLKRVVQLSSSFIYFFYFRWLASKITFQVNFILSAFALWFFCLSLFFAIDPAFVLDWTRSIYGRLVTEEDVVFEHFRFAYLFSDPNTAIYFLLIAVAPLLMQAEKKITILLILFFISVPLFLCQSRGGMISFVLMAIAANTSATTRSIFSPRRWFIVLMIVFVAYAVFLIFKRVAESNFIVDLAYSRLFLDSDDEYGYGYGYVTAGGRDDIWNSILLTYQMLPLGRGYKFDEFGPHSDFLRVIYSYGFIALPFLIWFLFNKILRLPQLVIPAVIAFTVNTLIDEQKLLALYLSLLAVYADFALTKTYIPAGRKGFSIDRSLTHVPR